jgi:hypothetical protein
MHISVLKYVMHTVYLLHVLATKNFCNILMYVFFVIHLPEGGHMSGQNM